MPTVQQMIELSDTLTKTQTRIFEYMLNHPEAVCYDTLRNTAERIGVTEVSVLKVCRKLGCSGYAEMKEVFRHYVGERLKDSFDRSYTLETVDDRSRSDRGALLLIDSRYQRRAERELLSGTLIGEALSG